MVRWDVRHVLFTILLSAAALSSCGKDDSPVSASAPITTPPAVDQAIVGTWYETGSVDGIEFKNDGTWNYLYVYGNKLHTDPISYYDREPGGNFSTTPDGKIIFSWTDLSTWVTYADTSSYTFSNNDSTLTMRPGIPTAPDQRVYVRKAIGDMVVAM